MSAESPASPRPLGEISQEPAVFDQFLDRNQKNLIILAVVIALGAAAYIIYQGVQRNHEHSAGAALTQADDLSSLQKIVKEFPKTAAAGSARILLSEKQWTEGQQDDSIATLKDFLANNQEHPAFATAQGSLGSKLASQGKNDEATKTFEELATNESARFLAPFALLSLGDISKSAGDLAKAESYYQRAQNEFPDSTFANTATRRIGLLKAKPPIEIEPPPAPAETAPGSADSLPANLFPAPGSGLAPQPPVESTPAPSPAPAPAPEAPAPAPTEPTPPSAPTPAPQP